MSRQKTKIEAKPHGTIVVQQPMVRTFSTGGGHGPEDTLVGGDDRRLTKKWQGYPLREHEPACQSADSVNLNVNDTLSRCFGHQTSTSFAQISSGTSVSMPT